MKNVELISTNIECPYVSKGIKSAGPISRNDVKMKKFPIMVIYTGLLM